MATNIQMGQKEYIEKFSSNITISIQTPLLFEEYFISI
jgi:hypothetical protein